MPIDFREPAPGSLALMQRFVNSVEVGGRADRFRDCDSAGRWLQQNALASDDEAVPEPDRLRLVALRDTVRSMLRGNHRGLEDADAFGRMNDIAARTPFVIELRDGQAVLRPLGEGVERAIGELIGSIHSAMRDGAWQRLKLCADETCPCRFLRYFEEPLGGLVRDGGLRQPRQGAGLPAAQTRNGDHGSLKRGAGGEAGLGPTNPSHTALDWFHGTEARIRPGLGIHAPARPLSA